MAHVSTIYQEIGNKKSAQYTDFEISTQKGLYDVLVGVRAIAVVTGTC